MGAKAHQGQSGKDIDAFQEMSKSGNRCREPGERKGPHQNTRPMVRLAQERKAKKLASAKNRRSANDYSSRSRCRNQGAMGKRTAFPTFDGKQKKLSEFTCTFKELI